MNKIIKKYLTRHYYVRGDEIFTLDNKLKTRYFFVNDLIKVFGLSEKELKYYIKGWLLKQNRNFNFKVFWTSWRTIDKSDPFDAIVFPLVNRVVTQTVVQELGTVQPMAAPRGLSFYMDFVGGNQRHNQFSDLEPLTPHFPRYETPEDLNAYQLIYNRWRDFMEQ